MERREVEEVVRSSEHHREQQGDRHDGPCRHRRGGEEQLVRGDVHHEQQEQGEQHRGQLEQRGGVRPVALREHAIGPGAQQPESRRQGEEHPDRFAEMPFPGDGSRQRIEPDPDHGPGEEEQRLAQTTAQAVAGGRSFLLQLPGRRLGQSAPRGFLPEPREPEDAERSARPEAAAGQPERDRGARDQDDPSRERIRRMRTVRGRLGSQPVAERHRHDDPSEHRHRHPPPGGRRDRPPHRRPRRMREQPGEECRSSGPGQQREQREDQGSDDDVHREQVAEKDADRDEPVVGPARDQVIRPGPEPAQRGAPVVSEDVLCSAARITRAGHRLPGEEPAQETSGERSAGDGREEVDVAEPALRREFLDHAEREGGAADASAGERQSDHVPHRSLRGATVGIASGGRRGDRPPGGRHEYVVLVHRRHRAAFGDGGRLEVADLVRVDRVAPLMQEGVGRLLADHEDRREDEIAGDLREHRGVDDAEPPDAMDPEMAVQDCVLVGQVRGVGLPTITPHAARPARVVAPRFVDDPVAQRPRWKAFGRAAGVRGLEVAGRLDLPGERRAGRLGDLAHRPDRLDHRVDIIRPTGTAALFLGLIE